MALFSEGADEGVKAAIAMLHTLAEYSRSNYPNFGIFTPSSHISNVRSSIWSQRVSS
jgi:hypothetical protein